MSEPTGSAVFDPGFEDDCVKTVCQLEASLQGDDGKLLLFRLKELLADKPEPTGLYPEMLARNQQAIGFFEMTTELAPHDHEALETLRGAYVQIGNFRKALETSFKIATAYEMLNMLDKAKATYRAILDVFPGHQKAWEGFDKLNAPKFYQGREIHLESPEIVDELPPEERERLVGAIKVLEGTSRLNPGDYETLEILKEYHSKLGNKEDVLRVQRLLAVAYFESGDLVDAQLECESILSKNPKDEEAKRILAKIENHLQPPPE